MASLGVLSSGVAHEINNPLGVILGYASYLEGKMSPDDPGFKYMHEIKRESKRCKKIARIFSLTPGHPTGHGADRYQRPSGADRRFCRQSYRHAPRNRADRALRRPPRDHGGRRPDPAGCHQPDSQRRSGNGGGGSLVVGTALADDGFIDISFRDTGAGIPADNLEKIFEPFFTTRRRGPGWDSPSPGRSSRCTMAGPDRQRGGVGTTVPYVCRRNRRSSETHRSSHHFGSTTVMI